MSSEVAASRLGAHPVQLRREELQLARGETLEDSARVLAGYLGLLMGRAYDHATLSALAAPGTLPVVNGLSDRFHPLQVLADLLTMRMEWGADLRERTLAYVGDGNNVAASLLLGGAMAGLRAVVAAPSGYAPDGGVVAEAMAIAATTGGDVAVTEDAPEAADGADVLYTDGGRRWGWRVRRRPGATPSRASASTPASSHVHGRTWWSFTASPRTAARRSPPT